MEKVLTLLGFAKKARKLVAGANAVQRSILFGKSSLVIVTNDAGDSIKNKMSRLCEENEVIYIVFGNSSDLSKATGEENKVVFSVEDLGFAKSIIQKIC